MLRLFWLLISALRGLWVHFRGLPRKAALALGAAGAGMPKRPDRLWRTFAIVLPIALVAGIWVPKISLVMTPSIDAWAVFKAPGPIRRGDYVMFTMRHPIAGPDPVSVTKYALCLPGDRLTMIETPSQSAPDAMDGRYFCNGRPLGVSLPYAHGGIRLEHMHWSGIVPAGMAYVGSPHPRGFDSRYLGLIPIRKLTRVKRII